MTAEKVDESALNSFYRVLSNLVGVEGMVSLFEYCCGGTFNFPEYLYDAEFVIGKTIQEFNGENTRQLARKYGYSDQWIRLHLWQHGCGDDVLSLNSELSVIPVIEGELNYKMLQPIYRDFYLLLGTKSMKRFYLFFRGIRVEFPPYLYDADLVAKTVIKQYNGHNKKKLALRYGYSKWWVNNVLKKSQKSS